MARGKYAAKADTRLRVLESEALRAEHAKVVELESALRKSQQEATELRREIQSKAMEAASHLAAKEKNHLRNQIASLEHQAREEKVRNAVLVWELLHRWRFDRPAPAVISTREGHRSQEDSDTWQAWVDTHWEITAIFQLEWDEVERVQLLCEGHKWKISADEGMGSAREVNRLWDRGLNGALMKRERKRQEYFERIWKARQAGTETPPVEDFAEQLDTPEVRRSRLIEGMAKKAGRDVKLVDEHRSRRGIGVEHE